MGEGWWNWEKCLTQEQLKSHPFLGLDFSRSNKHGIFWHVVSSGYVYVLFSEAIAVSDFRSLEIYKNLDFPRFSFTFTVNSHADNHFYKYIYLFQILYRMKLIFL